MKVSRRVVMTPTDRSDPRNQAAPVYEQNKNENGREKPKPLPHQFTADDVFEKIVQPLNQPFPEVLDSTRDRFDPPGRGLGKDDDRGRDNPRYQHGVCYAKPTDLHDQLWL